MTAHAGSRLGTCFSSVPPNAPNDKWLISPQMYLGSDAKIELWVQSYTDDYGLEKYNIGISTTGNDPQDFEFVNGDVPEAAPTAWTKKSYSLASWSNQPVYVGINSVSNDAFILMIDDIVISSTVGLPETTGQNVIVYPNPARDQVMISSAPAFKNPVDIQVLSLTGVTVKEIRNATGQPLKIDMSGLREGLYFIKINYDQSQIIRKIHIVD